MARNLSQRRVLRALTLPFLAAIGFSTLGCSSNRDEEKGPNLGKNVQKIAYAVRQNVSYEEDGSPVINVAGGMDQVLDYLRYVPGGELQVYDLASKTAENILKDYPTADVGGLDVSFDATKIVFSMKLSSDDNFHIYWASVEPDGNGNFEIHQLTFGGSDDTQPAYMAGDRVIFVSNFPYTEMGTKADEYNHGRVVSQLATVSFDGDVKRCAMNQSHQVNPFSMADGRVGFSTWEHLENVNDAKLRAMNPDCTQNIAISGQHGKPANSLVQAVEMKDPNVFVAVATDRDRTLQAGALVKIDARNPNNPAIFYEEDPQYEVLTPAVPRGNEPSPVGRYRAPTILPDNRILVSWAPGNVNDLNELSETAPDFGVYVYDPATRGNQLVRNLDGSSELYAKAIAVRDTPPILGSIQDTSDAATPTTFGSIDVKQTSLASVHGETVSGAQFDGTPMDEALAQTKKVRIIEGFSSEAAQGVTMFGLTMAEGAALLGEADVYADGLWLANLPPYIPMHLQAIDEFELAIRNQTLWIQGMPGEDRVCGGCHENRNQPVLSGGQQLTMAAGKGAQNFNIPIMQRQEYPWYKADPGYEANEVQTVLDAKCVSCHNSGTTTYYTITMTNQITGVTEQYQIPRLDLSTTPITVTYDNKTNTYPASYVSLFFPAALEMDMEDAQITGTVPPKWAIPSDARNSALIEKLNITSSVDANKTAWAIGQPFSDPNIAGGARTMHPEDKGGTLTRDERKVLIRVIDMGGQYYARQNTGFVPYQYDPMGGKQY